MKVLLNDLYSITHSIYISIIRTWWYECFIWFRKQNKFVWKLIAFLIADSDLDWMSDIYYT